MFAGRRAVATRLVLVAVLWTIFVVWVVPQGLSLAHAGALPFADTFLRGRATTLLPAYLELWRWSALWATALGGTGVLLAVERRWLDIPAVSVAVLVAGTFLFHLASIRAGMWYGSDAALYLVHARSIVEGLPYAETGYLVNPTALYHSPPMYPPLFPLMLAPIYAAAGLDLHAMKVLVVAMTALAAIALYLFARESLPVGPSLIATWLFAFSPFVGWLKDDLASDIPFLAAVLFCLWLAERAQKNQGRVDAGWKRGLAVGLLCGTAVATRSIGIVLLPALLLADFLRVRRPSRYAAALAVTASGLVGLQELLMGSIGAYSTQTNWRDVGLLAKNALLNARFLTDMMFGQLPRPVAGVAAAVAFVAAVQGMVILLRRRWSPTPLFIAAYTAALLSWPVSSGPRILLPHLVLGSVFALAALGPPAGRQRWREVVAVTLIGLCVTSYVIRYRASSLAPLPDSYDRPEHAELAAFVSRESSPGDVFIAIAPRTFTLLTRRSASIYDIRLSLEDQWKYFNSIGADYLVDWQGSAERDAAYFAKLVRTYPDRLQLAFSNAAYTVYRIAPAGKR